MTLRGEGAEPICRRQAGLLYGLGNLVENAVDHARAQVNVTAEWDSLTVRLCIADDGPGLRQGILPRLGEPYVHRGARKASDDGLGLGLFIARTLLERSGGTIAFANAQPPDRGARASVTWPRAEFEAGTGAAHDV